MQAGARTAKKGRKRTDIVTISRHDRCDAVAQPGEWLNDGFGLIRK